jgi:hypothetical protein
MQILFSYLKILIVISSTKVECLQVIFIRKEKHETQFYLDLFKKGVFKEFFVFC